MRTRTIFTHAATAAATLALAFSLGFSARPAHHAEPPADAPNPLIDMADMQAAMDRWLDSIKPGPRHEYLKQFVGDWDTTMRLFMDPAAPPMETRGACTYSLIHGGRFLKQESTGHMMLPGADGNPTRFDLNGLGLTGYDNNRKLYTMCWTDSMTTGILTGTGSLSPDGSVMTFFGTMDEPMTGEIGKMVKYVTRVHSPDRHTFEIHEILYGDSFKVVEIEFKRKQ